MTFSVIIVICDMSFRDFCQLCVPLLLSFLLVACSDESPSTGSFISAVHEGAPTKLVFGVYTAEKASTVVEKYAPILSRIQANLSKRLDRDVAIKLEVAKDYVTGIENLVEGRVDFSQLGPASFVMAKKDNDELRIIAMESQGGERRFQGIIAVHQDSTITTLSELKGKRFAFGSELSTIGRYLSQAQLMDAGIHGEDLASFKFLGRHDTVGTAVAAGDYDAGALKDSTFEKLVNSGEPLRALATFDNVTKPWVAHPSLDETVFDALQGVMLELDGDCIGSISASGFVESGDHYYQPIRRAMAKVETFTASAQ